MNALLRTSLPLYTSKEIVWVGGNDDAVFDPEEFLPKLGPEGGVILADVINVHVQLICTTTVATIEGEDAYKVIPQLTIEQHDDEKRVAAVGGDSLRLNAFAEQGADRTHEHADIAVGAAQTLNFTVSVPMAKFFAHEPDDTSIPAYALRAVRVKMPTNAALSVGGTMAIASGKIWLSIDAHEEMSVVQHAVDCLYEKDIETADAGTFQVGGRLQSLFLFCPGAIGGLTLANLTALMVEGVHRKSLYAHIDLKQMYARARGASMSSFATTGAPRYTDPFIAADAGTLRAVAPLLTRGNRCFDGEELSRATLRLTRAGAMPSTPRLVYRVAKRKTTRMRELVMDTFRVDRSQVKTSGRTRRAVGSWDPRQAVYLPEKFWFSGDKPGAMPRLK